MVGCSLYRGGFNDLPVLRGADPSQAEQGAEVLRESVSIRLPCARTDQSEDEVSYTEFLARKARVWQGAGLEVDALPSQLFDWQAAIVRWALRKGKAAVFADCGLGKTYMQLAWLNATGQRGLILAPLCVAEQTVAEAAKLGLVAHYAPDAQHVGNHRIVVTNYERLDRFDVSAFGAVVLDESSILKAFDGKTRTKLIETFKATPFRLCCTATPAPNDIAELANHAEFLGLMTRAEFLATWFVHDDAGWRMKRHARQAFYRWLASWAVALRKPSDIGYSDAGFTLPPLTIRDCIVEGASDGESLFPELPTIGGLKGRLQARRSSLDARLDAAANLVHERGVQWMAWCGLNEESDAFADLIDGAVNVQGSDTYAEKVGAVQGFIGGKVRVLVSKSKILGFGMNFQHCSRMVFLGLGDSYESYYQCIRRCWRFGQTQPVEAWVVVSDREQLVVENVRRKEAAAAELNAELLAEMRDFEREEIAC